MRLIVIILMVMSCEVQAQTDVLKDPRDGHEYKTVQIGTQTWMAENLLYTGIPYSYCFDSLSPYCINKHCNDMYGAYYTWGAAQKACPAEWHLPGKEEVQKLLTTIGGTKTDKFKALIKGGSSGFNVILGSGMGEGRMNKDIAGVRFSKVAGFWTSTERGEYTACRFFFSTLKFVNFVAEKKRIVFSVRCIND